MLGGYLLYTLTLIAAVVDAAIRTLLGKLCVAQVSPPSIAEEVQCQLRDAMNFEGSDVEKQARIYLATFGIDYDAITKEQFVNIIYVLKLSKYMKSPANQRGKARPYQPHGKGKRKRK